MAEQKKKVGHLIIDGFIINTEYLQKLLGKKYHPLLENLTLSYINEMKIQKKYMNYNHCRDANNNAILQLPRNIFYLFTTRGLISLDNISINLPINKISFDVKYPELFDYQNAVVKHLSETIFNAENANKGYSACVLEMGAGLGKTRTMAGLISKLGVKTLYVVPTIYLANQTIEDLNLAFSSAIKNSESATIDENIDKNFKKPIVARLTTKTLSNECDIAVIVVNTCSRLPSAYFKRFSFIIYDEIHYYCGPSFANMFWRTYSRYNIGITATANHRIDKFDKLYKQHLICEIKATEIPNFNIDQYKWKGSAEIINYYAPAEFSGSVMSERGCIDAFKSKQKLFMDPYRLKLICFWAKELLKNPANDIFIFCEYKNYLYTIKKVLEDNNINFEIDANTDDTDAENTDDLEDPDDIEDIEENEENIENIEIVEDGEIDTEYNSEGSSADNNFESSCAKTETKINKSEISNIILDTKTLSQTTLKLSKDSSSLKEIKQSSPRLLIGGVSSEQIKVVKQSRLTLTTFAYSEKGISIQSKNCIILASPRKTGFIQIIGRIFRRGGDVNLPRRVIDIHDLRMHYGRHLYNRKIAYKEYNLEINSKKISYTDI